MRKLAIVMGLASTALAGPAFAKDDAWYVGVEGGGMLIEDSNWDLGTATNALRTDHSTGLDVDGIIGYDFGVFRTELEVGYKAANLSSVTTNVAGITGSTVGARYGDAGGTSKILSFMLNGLFDFGNEDGLSGYVGGGAGIARHKAHIYQLQDQGAAFADDTDSRFAWQAIAGIRTAVSSNVDLGLKYRFFNVNNVKLTAWNGAEMKGDIRSHSLLASLIYNFGEPAAPPPPPPPPPPPVEEAPPPPPPPAQVAPGPFIVFFDWDKSDITPEAASILDNAAAAYAQGGTASVMLAGHADKSGSDQYNVGLSQRRADAVKAYLGGKGIPETAMSTEAFGESRPLVETADGVREPQNRRVEITYGPGSGN